ncbi:FAD-dependent monooxygenase [Arthrobacter castelli]|uniref:FAD-dependent monooxygenase n=1 Tax=Arthrobacter castelli TaxID=271431 RepID=UPI00040DF1EB|nr:FAD-dependent monooxygenase [Arthrobacter castelli]
MEQQTGSDADVIIVGAGPTGLLLAGDLARAGVSCQVLERRGEESNLTRAFAVHARTLEILDARGVGDDLAATGAQVGGLRLFGRLEIDLSRLTTRYPYVLVTPQYNTERVLAARAQQLGVEIVSNADVVGLHQDADGVEVDIRGNDGDRSARRAAYVVGADGVGSTVRKAMNLSFPGKSAVQSVILADVRLRTQPAEVLTVDAAGDGFAFLAPFGDGWYRVIAWNRRRQLPDTSPVDLDEIQHIVKSVLGTDYGMHEARWMSRFHSDERQVTSYRQGRVLLAGDAAHVHSPAGGQGMNTGMQDAANLGWKLAAAVHGRGPEALLDSYQSERHPVGRAVLRGSGLLLRLALARSWASRLLRTLLKGTAGRLGLVQPQAAAAVSGIAISYPAAAGEHRLVGHRAPDLPLVQSGQGPRRLYEALRPGKFVLLSHHRLPGLPEFWRDRVISVTVEDTVPANAVLVRPDGYVAWASNEADPRALEVGVHEALAHWDGNHQGSQERY